MEPLRLHTVAARVVAWHNQHPLARRITAAQVQSVGYVALPYQLAGAGPAARAEPVLDHAEASAAQAPAAAPADSGSLRERALARARQPEAGPPPAPPAAAPALDRKQLRPAFHEDFIAPLKPRQVARWALRQGQPLAAAPADGPLRQVLADAPAGGAAPVVLYLLTAAIEAGPRRSRVLLGAGAGTKGGAVLGRRLWSLPRVATALLAPLLLAGTGLSLALRPASVELADHATPVHAEAAAASAAASVPAATGDTHAVAHAAPTAPDADLPSAPVDTHAAAPVDSHAAAPAAVHVVAHTEAPADAHAAVQTAVPPAAAAASASVVATVPLDVEPQRGVIDMPRLGRVVDKPKQVDDKPAPTVPTAPSVPPPPAAETQPSPAPPPVAAKPAQSPLARKPEPPPAAAPEPTRTAAVATAKPPAAAPTPRADAAMAQPGSGAFAVSTRPLRTRAEAEQTMAAMTALLRTIGDKDVVQVEILPNGPDWRVVGWPYQRQGDADKARSLLAARGMRVAVVGF